MAGRPCSLLSPPAWPVPLGCSVCLQSRLHRGVHHQLQRTVPRSEPVQRVWGRTALSLPVLSLLHVCRKLICDLLLLKVLNPKKKGKKKKYINSGTVSSPAFTVDLVWLVNPSSLLLPRWRCCPSKWNQNAPLWTSSAEGMLLFHHSYFVSHKMHPDIRRGEQKKGEERWGEEKSQRWQEERRGAEPFVIMIIILTKKSVCSYRIPGKRKVFSLVSK